MSTARYSWLHAITSHEQVTHGVVSTVCQSVEASMDDLSIDPFVASRGNFPQDDSCGHIISILPSWSSLRGGNVSAIKLKGEDSKEVRICRLFGVPHRLWGLWLAIDS